jgi:hypothetical protein
MNKIRYITLIAAVLLLVGPSQAGGSRDLVQVRAAAETLFSDADSQGSAKAHPGTEPDVPGLLIAAGILVFARWRAGVRAKSAQ